MTRRRRRRPEPEPAVRLLAAAVADDRVVPGQDPAERHHLRRRGRRDRQQRQRQHARHLLRHADQDQELLRRLPQRRSATTRATATGGLCALARAVDDGAARSAGACGALALIAIVLAPRGGGDGAVKRATLAGARRCWPGSRRPRPRRARRRSRPTRAIAEAEIIGKRFKTAAAVRVRAALRSLPARRRRRVRRRPHPYQDYFGVGQHLLTADRVRLRDLPPLRHARASGSGLGYFSVTGDVARRQRHRPAERRQVDAQGGPGQPVGDLPLRLLPRARAASRWCRSASWGSTGPTGRSPTATARSRPTAAAARGAAGRWAGTPRPGWRWCSTSSIPRRRATSTTSSASTTPRWCSSTRTPTSRGLGQSDRLHVGDTNWSLGLMFEF